jgi:hypothetical protein
MDKLEDGKYEIGKGIVELNGIIFRLSFPEQGEERIIRDSEYERLTGRY